MRSAGACAKWRHAPPRHWWKGPRTVAIFPPQRFGPAAHCGSRRTTKGSSGACSRCWTCSATAPARSKPTTSSPGGSPPTSKHSPPLRPRRSSPRSARGRRPRHRSHRAPMRPPSPRANATPSAAPASGPPCWRASSQLQPATGRWCAWRVSRGLARRRLSRAASRNSPPAAARPRSLAGAAPSGSRARKPTSRCSKRFRAGSANEAVARAMKRTAPTWQAQFAPPSRSTGVPEQELAASPAASQARMKLELAAFLEAVCHASPLVLFFDDVHWIDPSTVDLLAYLGSRIASLRLLIVLAYRPSEMLLGKNVFWPMKLDLQTHGVCREIGLDFLTQDEVAQYLALEFPGHGFSPAFAALVHARTEGSPLFMVDLVRYLRDHGAIVKIAGSWALAGSLPDIERGLPESVRSMIERQLGQLAPIDRRLLVVASVQGQEFDSAVVARVLSRDPAGVEERLENLEHVHAFIRPLPQRDRPSQLQSVRYRFVHVLYQNALYASLTPTRRTSLSAAVAGALLEFHADDSSVVASELALLYEAARDAERSARHFLLAAE